MYSWDVSACSSELCDRGDFDPSDGLTKSFKFKEMLINLEREVGLVPGLDTNKLSWSKSFLFHLQSEEGGNQEGDPDCRIDM